MKNVSLNWHEHVFSRTVNFNALIQIPFISLHSNMNECWHIQLDGSSEKASSIKVKFQSFSMEINADCTQGDYLELAAIDEGERLTNLP